MKPMYIGIIGAGLAGTSIAKGFARVKNVKISAVYNRSREKGEAFARQFNAQYYDSVEELLSTNVQAVAICTSHGIHEENAIAAAKAGKHILMEKPLAISMDSAQRILKACRQAKIKVMMGMTHRFYPETLEVKQQLQDGAIGDIFMAVDKMIFSTQGFQPWVFEAKEAGHGVFLDNGIHGINRLRWLLRSEVTEVSAQCGTFAMDVDTEDNGIAFLKFKNGVFASMIQGVLPGEHLTCDLELYGSDGFLRMQTWRGYTLINRSTNIHKMVRPEMINLWDGIDLGTSIEVNEFIRYLLDEIPNPVPLEEGIEDLKVILAIYDSSEKGEIKYLDNV